MNKIPLKAIFVKNLFLIGLDHPPPFLSNPPISKKIRTEVIEEKIIICLDPPTFLFKFVLNPHSPPGKTNQIGLNPQQPPAPA